jgi:hypothetical protein
VVGEGKCKELVAVDDAGGMSSPVYTKVDLNGELRQGEILTSVVQNIYNQSSGEVDAISHPFVVVASQDCDLLQDFNKRRDMGQSTINGILLYEAEPTSIIRPKLAPGSEYWKIVKGNTNDRYHALEKVPKQLDNLGIGLPDLIIDFKRFFSLTAAELTFQTTQEDAAARRCRLETPYREHFQARLAFYFSRVALPRGHQISPLAP